jgi:type VI secretion system secreted protein Hcp
MTATPPSNSAAAATSDIYLSVQTKRAGKIKGEAVAPDHENDILVASWHWGVSAGSAIGSGKATARRSYKHLVVHKGVDSASTGLISALVGNDEVKEARLAMRKAGEDQEDFFTIVLGGARVTAVDIHVDGNGTPLETVEFAFTKIDVEYKRQDAGGQAGASSSFSDEFLQQ